MVRGVGGRSASAASLEEGEWPALLTYYSLNRCVAGILSCSSTAHLTAQRSADSQMLQWLGVRYGLKLGRAGLFPGSQHFWLAGGAWTKARRARERRAGRQAGRQAGGGRVKIGWRAGQSFYISYAVFLYTSRPPPTVPSSCANSRLIG